MVQVKNVVELWHYVIQVFATFEQKFEKMLFSKILDKETYMTMSNKEHNEIISHLFSAKKLEG